MRDLVACRLQLLQCRVELVAVAHPRLKAFVVGHLTVARVESDEHPVSDYRPGPAAGVGVICVHHCVKVGQVVAVVAHLNLETTEFHIGKLILDTGHPAQLVVAVWTGVAVEKNEALARIKGNTYRRDYVRSRRCAFGVRGTQHQDNKQANLPEYTSLHARMIRRARIAGQGHRLDTAFMLDSSFRPGRLAATYSIVARDPATGTMGVAVQSHAFAVGAIVPWARAGVGVVATQALVNVDIGPQGLARLAAGDSPERVVDGLAAGDSNPAVRQFAVLDSRGRAAAYTGQRCIAVAGHATDVDVSVQANMMDRGGVPERMLAAWYASTGPLAERLLAVLRAAEEGGGDIRGMQSAAVLVVPIESAAPDSHDRLVDLRVDDHPEPLNELGRLMRFAGAYRLADEAEQAAVEDRTTDAAARFGRAADLAPELEELRFWEAIALAETDPEYSRTLIAELDAADATRRWYRLALRMPPTGMFAHASPVWDRLLAPEPGLLYHIHEGDSDLPEAIRPASLDTEGFVHCSFAHQLRRVQERHFPAETDPILLEIDPRAVDAELRIEDLYGLDENFPHLYGAIPRSAVRRHGTMSELLPGL